MKRDDEFYMNRALDLARRPSFTTPNPRVGCVIVRNGEIISEGAHEGCGTPHAEQAALAGVDATGATLYVNLEPCAHHGRTEPCAPLVVGAGVVRAVVAIEDPDPRVSGRGLDLLRSAGIEVVTGVSSEPAQALNRSYLHHRRTGLPFVTLKLAMSIDGRMAAPDGSSRWITGEKARGSVHRRRLDAGTVMVGAGTVLADDPELTVRHVDAPRQPLRVVIDGPGRIPATARMFSAPGETLIATATAPHEIVTAWKETGAEVVVVATDAGRVDIPALLAHLGRRDVVEVYCEGGVGLASYLLAAGLADGLEIHHGPLVLGGEGLTLGDVGVRAIEDARRWALIDVNRFEDDVVTTYIKRS